LISISKKIKINYLQYVMKIDDHIHEMSWCKHRQFQMNKFSKKSRRKIMAVIIIIYRSSRRYWGSHDDRICLTWTSVLFSLFWYVTTACELLLMPLCFGLRTTTWVKLAPLKWKRFDKYRDFQIQTYALIRSHFGLSTPTSNSYLSLG
jgi:hypothetical protein